MKTTVAENQLDEEKQSALAETETMPGQLVTDTLPEGSSEGEVSVQPVQRAFDLPNNTRFYMSAKLDNTRIIRAVQRLVDEIVKHLSSIEGATVEMHLDVNVSVPEGFSTQVVRTVDENSRTLNVDTYWFED